MSLDTFERLKTRGLDARRAGNHAAARVYLLEAARLALESSRAPGASEALRAARRRSAERLLELSRDCASTGHRRDTPDGGYSAQSGDSSATRTVAGAADAWVVRERPRVRFDDIAGLEDVKEQIRLRMVYPFLHPELAERYDVRAGGGMLMYGPPGTGKTLLARATAGEIDAAFYRVSGAELLSMWVGEAEQNVAKLFAAASAEPRAIVFIDEVESLLPARRDDASTGGVMQRVVPQFLQALDGFDRSRGAMLFLAATNLPWQLDPAVLRPGRFDDKVYVPLPDLPARVRLLEMYLKHRPLADDVDLPDLAGRLEGYSGADIRHICDKAATIPFLRSIAAAPAIGVDRDEAVAIAREMLDSVIASTPPSVSKETAARFDRFA